MIKKTESTEVSKAYGNKLPEPFKVSFSYEAFESLQEAEAAKKLLNDKALLKAINAREKASARQKAITEAYDARGIKAPAADSAEVLTRQFIRTMRTAGKSLDEAHRIAQTALGDKYAAGKYVPGQEEDEEEDDDTNGEE